MRLITGHAALVWNIDEVFVRISGKQMYLWRFVNNDGELLDVLLQSKMQQKCRDEVPTSYIQVTRLRSRKDCERRMASNRVSCSRDRLSGQACHRQLAEQPN